MITRLQLLRNIGKFDSVDSAANITLAPLTLVYSENGRGKTTLAAILRSLATGDPDPILERRRLAAQNPPHVIIDIVECDGSSSAAVFQNDAWSRTLPNVVIFDDLFIDENVHSGLGVGTHHRQNLNQLILGGDALRLSRRLQELVAQIEVHNTSLRAKAEVISAVDRGPFSADEFCGLCARRDIDEAIQEVERNLAAARNQDAIRSALPLDSFSIPGFDLALIEGVLEQDLPALDATTVVRLQTHFGYLGHGGEAWVAEGMRRTPQMGASGETAKVCPFCIQDLSGSPVIREYQAYFSQAYSELKQRVSAELAALKVAHRGEVLAGFERAVRISGERSQFWSRFCEVKGVLLDTAAIVRAWREALEAVSSQLAAKQGAPLERMTLADNTKALVAIHEAHRSELAALNGRFQAANEAIAVVRERVAVANSQALEADLTRLKAIKARDTTANRELCDNYTRERRGKTETEQLRDQAKADLEQHRATVFPGYQNAINIYLQKFNAGFRLESVNSNDTRGGPVCNYNMIINNTAVPVAGGDPVPGEPSFRNTLSAGDRNTLALAVFFAGLDRDPALRAKVIVVDDPISSLDEHRTLATVQEIRRLAGQAAQVIVFSHNRSFLCRLWERTDSTLRAALQVARDGEGSTVRTWDVDRDSITEHDHCHARLRRFLASGSGDQREVAKSVRPLLEAFLRVARPEHFPPGTLLGHFLGTCQQRLETPAQILDRAATQELRALVEYSNKFHHNTNPAWETETINDGELSGFVRRAMEFAKR